MSDRRALGMLSPAVVVGRARCPSRASAVGWWGRRVGEKGRSVGRLCDTRFSTWSLSAVNHDRRPTDAGQATDRAGTESGRRDRTGIYVTTATDRELTTDRPRGAPDYHHSARRRWSVARPSCYPENPH